MSTEHPQIRRLALSALAATVALGVSQPARAGYGWPVKPFHVQHPVRGFFGDPRIGRSPAGGRSRQFHFGVDVSAPNGTPVYATMTGESWVSPRHPDVVSVVAGSREFEYWHVVPAVRTGVRVVAYRTVIGHVEKPWAHVHFSERLGGVYVNPLRAGAMKPFVDRTAPTVHAFSFDRHGTRVDVVSEVFDTTPVPVPAPWTGKPVMPAVVRWRLRGPNAAAGAWRTAADFRRTIPSASLFDAVYARWTRQNHASVRGRYRVYLVRGLETATLPDGRYRIDVEALDEQGNRAAGSVAFTLRQHVLTRV